MRFMAFRLTHFYTISTIIALDNKIPKNVVIAWTIVYRFEPMRKIFCKSVGQCKGTYRPTMISCKF